MFKSVTRYAAALATLAALAAPALGQAPAAPRASEDNRRFLKPPETPADYWKSLNYEIEVGKFDLAAEFLKGFLAKNPTDADLLAVVDKEGTSAFTRLLSVGVREVEEGGRFRQVLDKDARQLRELAGPLVERVNDVVLKHLSDPQRLVALIRDLQGGPEERAFAINQLRRAGAPAMPTLVEALLATKDDPDAHNNVLSALPRLGPDIVPPLVAAFDVGNDQVRRELVEVLQKRDAVAAAPHLWHLAGSPKQSPEVRNQARATLAHLLRTDASRLPEAKVALTREAERYYRHGVPFANKARETVWRWEENKLVGHPVPATKAEEYHGLRFARQALDLDPAYQPAQVVYVSLALDKAYERTGLDKSLTAGAPALKDVVSSVNPELLVEVLQQGINDRRGPVILGAAAALGDAGEVRAVRAARGTQPVLFKALNYPDPRVQFAAADAILRIPVVEPPAYAARVVEVLRRALAAEPQGKAAAKVLLGFPQQVAEQVAAAARQAGYEPVTARTGRELLLRLNQAADVDAVLLDPALPGPGLNALLSQIRSDVNYGKVPVVLAAEPTGPVAQEIMSQYRAESRKLEVINQMTESYRDTSRRIATAYRERTAANAKLRDTRRISEEEFKTEEANLRTTFTEQSQALANRSRPEMQMLAEAEEVTANLRRLSERYAEVVRRRGVDLEALTEGRGPVFVVPPGVLDNPAEVRRLVRDGLAQAQGQGLSEAERKAQAAEALNWLARLGRGEVAGYDIRPAETAVLAALRSEELVTLAVEAAGRLPSRNAQRELAALALDKARPAKIRTAAALELTRHLQQHGNNLSPEQVAGVEAAQAAEAGASLKAKLALVLGSLRPEGKLSGQRLQRYDPGLAVPQKEAPPER